MCRGLTAALQTRVWKLYFDINSDNTLSPWVPANTVSQLLGKTAMGSTRGMDCQKSKGLFIPPTPYTCLSKSQPAVQILSLSCCCFGENISSVDSYQHHQVWYLIYRGLLVNSLPPSFKYPHIHSSQSITRFFYLWSLCFSKLTINFPKLHHSWFPLNLPVLDRHTTHIVREASRVLPV